MSDGGVCDERYIELKCDVRDAKHKLNVWMFRIGVLFVINFGVSSIHQETFRILIVAICGLAAAYTSFCYSQKRNAEARLKRYEADHFDPRIV